MRGRAAVPIVALPLAALSVIGGLATPAYAIANGENAAQDQYRFAVKLTMTGLPATNGGGRNSSCSGALIAPRWVITAGHCFRTPDGKHVERTVADKTVATVGRAVLGSNAGHEATVIEVHQSPTTDVALAKIGTPITDIPPLALSTTAPAVGDVVRLAGFGATTRDESKTAGRLQTGRFTITSVTGLYVGTKGRAPRASTSACPHDSGGPYFSQAPDGHPVLVSVVSHGPPCPHSAEDLSGRIDTITDWIRQITGPDAVRPPPSPARTSTSTDVAVAAPQNTVGRLHGRTRLANRVGVPGVAVLLVGLALGWSGRRRRLARAYRRHGIRRHRRA